MYRMLATFVIGLREGLEAALIVGIIAAFLGQRGRRDALRQVWAGVAAAVVLCAGAAITLQAVSSSLPQQQQEGLETVVGALAVCMVTYMILFMRRHSRELKGGLEGTAASALAAGSSMALVAMAFLAVLREGLETAVFLLATFQASGDAAGSWAGAVIGIVVAVVIGAGIYRGGLRINLSRFFRFTGLVLVVLAAGLVMTALRTASEAGWLTAGQAQAFDLSWLVRPGTPWSSLLTGVLGIQPDPAWIEVIGWLCYLVPMVLLVAWSKHGNRAGGAGTAAGAGDQTADLRHLPASRAAIQRRKRTRRSVAATVAGCALLATGCSSLHSTAGNSSGAGAGAAGQTKTVTIDLTSQGCAPKPAKIAAGSVRFMVTNTGADGVSEAELRTSDLSKILGEQENLTPGLSGEFALFIQPGSYTIACPGAAQEHWTFVVTGTPAGPSWQSSPALASAVRSYGGYVGSNAAALVSHTQVLCQAVSSGSITQAQLRYPQARVYYERIEPVAEIWGSLDTSIDGRWENPVTVASQFIGFHKIEELLWRDHTLAGVPKLCAGLVTHEQQLLALVRSAQYNPLEMASGATELINEAATAKITGEEERYSNTDLPVFQANVDGAMKIVALLRPYLQHKDPGLLTQIEDRDQAVERLMTRYQASPGYDDTGYVDYSTVTAPQRRQLSAAVNALAESLSKLSAQVSG
jgi:high-affinity iron transporter